MYSRVGTYNLNSFDPIDSLFPSSGTDLWSNGLIIDTIFLVYLNLLEVMDSGFGNSKQLNIEII
jgi:hypothetical protein